MNNDSKLEKELSRRIEKEKQRGFLSTFLMPGSVYNTAVLLDNIYSLYEKKKNEERTPEIKKAMFVRYTIAIFIESVRLAAYGYLVMKMYESLHN